MLWGKYLVKIVNFSPSKLLVRLVHLFQLRIVVVCIVHNFYLVIAIYLDFTLLVARFEVQHWPNTHCHLDSSTSTEAFTPAGRCVALVVC
jgi:hypothetical protein